MSVIKRLVMSLLIFALLLIAPACEQRRNENQPQPSQCTIVENAPVILDPAYTLDMAQQNAKGNRQGVYYEIFVRAFADSNGDGIGDINGLISKLDYLNDANSDTTQDLGITGIWLMPVNKTASYHGYDVTDYYDINPDYGNMADFEELLQQAHKRGISVIMDLVLNHTSDKHQWFLQSSYPDSNYRDWYHWTLDGSEGYNLNARIWGHKVWNLFNGGNYLALFWSGMPDLNYDNPEVREEAKAIAGFWLDKGVDGFRLDAVPHIYDASEVLDNSSTVQKTVDWWKEFKDFCHEKAPGSLIIGEVLDENVNTRATYLASLDSTFHIGLGTQITSAIRMGMSKNSYLSAYIAKTYTQYAKTNPDYLDAPMLSNHDQNRIIGMVQGKHELMKVAASIYLTLEGVPFIYYGEEIGMYGAKPDEDIRLPFVWGSDDPAQTTWRKSKYAKVEVPVFQQQENSQSLLTHYKRVIRVRNENEALYSGKFEALPSDNDAILAYAMKSQNQSAIVIHNLSKEQQTVTMSTEGYSLVFCQSKNGFQLAGDRVTLGPLNSVIWVSEKP